MTNPVRTEIIRLVERVSDLAPDVRFGQMVAFLVEMTPDPQTRGLWDLEDEELLAALRQHHADLVGRMQNVA